MTDFFFDVNEPDESDEEQIKDIWLIFLDKTIFESAFFEGAILKMKPGCLSSQ